MDTATQDRQSQKKTAAGIQVRLIAKDDVLSLREMEQEIVRERFTGIGGVPATMPGNMRSLGGR